MDLKTIQPCRQNNLHELWALLQFLLPGMLSSERFDASNLADSEVNGRVILANTNEIQHDFSVWFVGDPRYFFLARPGGQHAGVANARAARLDDDSQNQT